MVRQENSTFGTMPELGTDAETVMAALQAGSACSMQYFRRPVSIEIKPDLSPVTIADRATEQEMRAVIAACCPDDGIWGEEQGRDDGGDRLWVIDPIDGTKSFLLGNPLYGCLAGLVVDGKVIAGGAAVPPLNEYWLAVPSKGAFLNGARLQTSAKTTLADASLLSTSPDFFDAAEREKFDRVSEKAQFRRYGGDCYAYLQVAAGWADAVVESSLQPYDYLALVPIIEEAGGVISDWQGQPLNLESGPQVVAAASAGLHDEILAHLAR